MSPGILGRKIGMTQLFDENGNLVPVTVVQAGPCVVVQKRTLERDGYEAVQLGYGSIKERKVTRPMKGHFQKAGVEPRRLLREFPLKAGAQLEEGQVIDVGMFSEGQYVDVSGTSRGKGFAGSIKRHGFARGPMSHGSKYHRGTGGLSGSTYPGRVFKGRRMPGRMGGRRVTVRGLPVLKVDAERHLLVLRGSVPGARGSIVEIRPTTVAGKKSRE